MSFAVLVDGMQFGMSRMVRTVGTSAFVPELLVQVLITAVGASH